MIIIYPTDPSTKFLAEIPQIIYNEVDDKFVKLVSVEANLESYKLCIELISQAADESTIIFMGHGQDDCLFGGENEEFPKQALISPQNIKLFARKNLFSLSCNSNAFLKNTFRHSNIKNSVGFGSIPTEVKEIEYLKKSLKYSVNENVIEEYKKILVNLVANSVINMIKNNKSFIAMRDYFLLLLNKKISEVILNDKGNLNSRILSDLLFLMKVELIMI